MSLYNYSVFTIYFSTFLGLLSTSKRALKIHDNPTAKKDNILMCLKLDKMDVERIYYQKMVQERGKLHVSLKQRTLYKQSMKRNSKNRYKIVT